MIFNKSNADYINNVKLKNPASINENAYDTMEECELKSLFEYSHNMDVLCEELLLESPNFRSFFDSIKRFIIAAFNKFTDIIQKVISVFPINLSSHMNFSEKYKFQIIKGFDIVKESREEYTGLAYNNEAINEYGKHISDIAIVRQIRYIASEAKDPAYVYGEIEKYHICRSNIIKGILDSDTDYGYESVEEVKAHIEKDIGGQDKINLVEYYTSGSSLCDILRRRTSKEIRTEYKNVKSIINECIKAIDEAYKHLFELNNKSHTYDIDGGRRVFTELTNHVKFIQNICQQVSATLARHRYNELAQARKFAIACINAYERKEKEEQGV